MIYKVHIDHHCMGFCCEGIYLVRAGSKQAVRNLFIAEQKHIGHPLEDDDIREFDLDAELTKSNPLEIHYRSS